MGDEFLSHVLNNHLIKQEIKSKKKYLSDLHYAISRSFSGRVGVEISNNFLFEAEHMVANSINLYEEGYFDAAFYSLRAVLELFMLMVYLIEHQESELNTLIKKWDRLENMDTYSRMDSHLSKKSDLYKNIKGNMFEYFESIRVLNKNLNKKVHKQSFINLYTNRSHPFHGRKYNLNEELSFFESSVKKIIGAVVVFRLFIDPMPILLMDEEIYLRVRDTMSGPLLHDFIADYIGYDHIESYKNTEIYKAHYNEIINEVKLYESVAFLVKYNTIDLSKKEEIEEQFEHLYDISKLAYLIAKISDKIYAIDIHDGMYKFRTSNIPKEKQPYIKNMEYLRYLDLQEIVLNSVFQDIIVSIFPIQHGNIFIEQSEELSQDQLLRIKDLIEKYKI